jgi:PAS domain S-box-containing protein
MLGVMNNITERKRAEEALRESERRYRSTFENAAVGIVHFGLDGSFLRVNERLCRLLGYTREELLKTNWMAISHPDEVQLNLELRERHLRGETEDYSLEKRYFRSDGSVVWVNLTASLLRDEQNEPLYFIAFIEDITVRKQLEAERERVLEQERQARQLAEEANRARDEWLAMVTHQLRSPLNAILGYARMLDQNPGALSPEVTEIIRIIKRNGERQRLLIDDLLDTARVISGKLRLEIRPLNLASVIREAIETVRPAAAARQILITSQLDEQAGLITGDPDRLQQVVWNLLSNAVRFTLTGGSVHVELKRDDARARIIVTDTGAGIEPDFLPHVFERFSQQDTSRSRRYGGLGLGLALVKQIIELHGGTITAASPGAGEGAVFTITLPLQMADFRLRNEETGKSFIPSHREDQSAIRNLQSEILKGVQALVIDDEADTRELVMTLLAGQGAEIETAATAAAAWEALTAPHRPQIIVCDIGMPGEDGYSLLRRLRVWERERNLKPLLAIALTAHNSSGDRLQALLAGFQMHVAKPVEPEELITVIKSLVDRASLSDGARV